MSNEAAKWNKVFTSSVISLGCDFARTIAWIHLPNLFSARKPQNRVWHTQPTRVTPDYKLSVLVDPIKDRLG